MYNIHKIKMLRSNSAKLLFVIIAIFFSLNAADYFSQGRGERRAARRSSCCVFFESQARGVAYRNSSRVAGRTSCACFEDQARRIASRTSSRNGGCNFGSFFSSLFSGLGRWFTRN